METPNYTETKLIDKKTFKKKLCEKYGDELGKFIILSTYSTNEQKIDPTKILDIFEKIMN